LHVNHKDIQDVNIRVLMNSDHGMQKGYNPAASGNWESPCRAAHWRPSTP